METKEKKDKKGKKDKGLKSANTGVRLMKKGNVNKTESTAKLLGQLTEVIGEGAYYELYSDTNFYGTKQVMIKGWFAESNPDEDQFDFKLICDRAISQDLRSAKTEEELNDLLDELEYADCLHRTVQSTTSNGEKRFDDKGDPIMEDIYSLQFSGNNTDMSSTRRTSSGVANKEYKKEKKAFSFKAGGLY